MKKNIDDPDARQITYDQFPKYYVWKSDKKIWTKRKKRSDVIGRIYFVQPNEGER